MFVVVVIFSSDPCVDYVSRIHVTVWCPFFKDLEGPHHIQKLQIKKEGKWLL